MQVGCAGLVCCRYEGAVCDRPAKGAVLRLEGVIHCEGPECDHHQHVGVPNMNAGRLPVGWLRVTEHGDTGPIDFGYCGWNCLMKAAAQVPPPIEIPWNEALGTDEPERGE